MLFSYFFPSSCKGRLRFSSALCWPGVCERECFASKEQVSHWKPHVQTVKWRLYIRTCISETLFLLPSLSQCTPLSCCEEYKQLPRPDSHCIFLRNLIIANHMQILSIKEGKEFFSYSYWPRVWNWGCSAALLPTSLCGMASCILATTVQVCCSPSCTKELKTGGSYYNGASSWFTHNASVFLLHVCMY